MAATRPHNKTILALDIGARRIGVAVASLGARLPRPLTTLNQSSDTIHQICELLEEHQAIALVCGLPRGLNGQDTAQTSAVREFVASLETKVSVPVYLMDEALTSKQAEAELKQRGATYTRGDIDALAACYILTDFLVAHKEEFIK
jgi:putative Holliday junction resolvase